MKKGFKANQGFSFIGTLVATFIATVGIMAIFTLSNFSLQAANTSKMRLVASGLTQEGVEIVRDIRKSYAEWSDWEWYSTSSPMIAVGETREYCVDYTTVSLSGAECPGSEAPLKIYSIGGAFRIYQYVTGDPSPFYRKVVLTRESLDEIKVISEVKWKVQGRGNWRYLRAEDRLWRWK
jgi:Tfp pilus assembly protein PilV